jgi:hypothetical protein
VDLNDILLHPFTWGLVLGLIFAALALYRTFRISSELKRFKRHLGEKVELEADTLNSLKQKVETLRQENENLRQKISAYNEPPERQIERELEILARAEKRMVISIPGFVGPWEQAKRDALAELEAEESGRSMPKRIFRKLFTAGRAGELPEKSKPQVQE